MLRLLGTVTLGTLKVLWRRWEKKSTHSHAHTHTQTKEREKSTHTHTDERGFFQDHFASVFVAPGSLFFLLLLDKTTTTLSRAKNISLFVDNVWVLLRKQKQQQPHTRNQPIQELCVMPLIHRVNNFLAVTTPKRKPRKETAGMSAAILICFIHGAETTNLQTRNRKLL